MDISSALHKAGPSTAPNIHCVTRVFLLPSRKSTIPMFRIGLVFRYTVMRSISYCLDVEQARKTPEHSSSAERTNDCTLPDYHIFDFLEYIMFFPTFHCGPLVAYEDFSRMVASYGAGKMSHFISTALDLLPNVLLALTVEVAMRTFYYPLSLLQSLDSMAPFDVWTFLMAVLLIIYAESCCPLALSRACSIFCGISTPQEAPVLMWFCTSSMQAFCRKFHASWHCWLVKYIYKPSSGGVGGVFLTFIVSLLLHGDVRYEPD